MNSSQQKTLEMKPLWFKTKSWQLRHEWSMWVCRLTFFSYCCFLTVGGRFPEMLILEMPLFSYPFQSLPCQSEIPLLPMAVKGKKCCIINVKRKPKLCSVIILISILGFQESEGKSCRRIFMKEMMRKRRESCHVSGRLHKGLFLGDGYHEQGLREKVLPDSATWKLGTFLCSCTKEPCPLSDSGCLHVFYGTFSSRTPACAAGNLSHESNSFANSPGHEAESLILRGGGNGLG